MRTLFSRLTLITLLIFSANTAIGQPPNQYGPGIWLDGEMRLSSVGDIGVAYVSMPRLQNNHNINWANVYANGRIDNGMHGTIGTANVYENGLINNNNGSSIGLANVHGDGQVANSGILATIGTINVYDNGQIRNFSSATIDMANVRNNGTIYNYGNASIDTANIRSGWINNYDNATVGTLFLDGGTVNNISRIDNLIYTGGTYNGRQAERWWGNWSQTQTGTGTIGTLTVSTDSGEIDWGNLGTANVYENGLIRNANAATIGAANVYESAQILNQDHAYIGEANVYSHWGITNQDNAQIGEVNVYGHGLVTNQGNAQIGEVNIYGHGQVGNYSSTIDTVNVYDNGILLSGRPSLPRVDDSPTPVATIGTATVSDNGRITNCINSTIDNLTMNGGHVANTGRIEEMTYFSGEYRGWMMGLDYTDWSSITTYYGSIGTLTLAGDATGIDWGIVDNIRFDSNGAGILSISAFGGASPNSGTGIQAFSASLDSVTFTGINAKNVDLTHGRISLDLSALSNLDDNGASFFNLFEDGFSFATLFDGANIDGGLAGFQVVLGDNFTWVDDLLDFVTRDMFENDWVFNGTEIVVGNFHPNSIPEPATLAIVGLGLAGLGLARRRRA